MNAEMLATDDVVLNGDMLDDETNSEEYLDDKDLLPKDVTEDANNARADLLPSKSCARYIDIYNTFMNWKKEKKVGVINKDVLLAYFSHLAKNYKPPTLWSVYSMLKTVLKNEHNINIAEYGPLIAFIKRKNEGYRPKKSKILTAEKIKTFIKNAPDDIWLATKVISIFGIYGGLRLIEIAIIKVTDVEDHRQLLLVKISETKTKVEKSFTIGAPYYDMIKKYEALRPEDPEVTRYFLNYQSGRCTRQVISRNKIGSMPKEIAKFLNLPNKELYTGHCFRRSSASILANAGASSAKIMRHGAWASEKTAKSYVEDSLQFKNDTAQIFTKEISSSSENETLSTVKKPRLRETNPDASVLHSVENLTTGSEDFTTNNSNKLCIVIQMPKNFPFSLSLTNCSNFEIHFKE